MPVGLPSPHLSTTPAPTSPKTATTSPGTCFTPSETVLLEEDFDRIVAQFSGSNENVNARRGSAAMERMGTNHTTVFHTHNVQNFSVRWL